MRWPGFSLIESSHFSLLIGFYLRSIGRDFYRWTSNPSQKLENVCLLGKKGVYWLEEKMSPFVYLYDFNGMLAVRLLPEINAISVPYCRVAIWGFLSPYMGLTPSFCPEFRQENAERR